MPGKLSYFDLNGRVDACRMALSHANFQYEDNRLSFEQFGAMKAGGELPLGSAPIWEEDGFTMCQSNAILRMIGIRCGYYHTDPMICWAIDSMLDFHEGHTNGWQSFWAPILGGADPATLADADITEWCEKFWDKVIPVTEARLAKHGKRFLAGTDRPTICDFKAFCAYANTFCNPGCPLSQSNKDKIQAKVDAAPCYAAWVRTMKAETDNYCQTRPARPF